MQRVPLGRRSESTQQQFRFALARMCGFAKSRQIRLEKEPRRALGRGENLRCQRLECGCGGDRQ
jgi:hypothetical protein